MTERAPYLRVAAWLAAATLVVTAGAVQAQNRSAARTGDFILAVVNQELVTNTEVETRIVRVREEAARSRQNLPPADELRRQVLDVLIDERVLVTYARDSGERVDEAEIDRAVANVAAQNQVSLAELRERLARQGIDFQRFRRNLRDQILVERVREREVAGRIRVTEAEIDAFIDKRRAETGTAATYNIAQILVTVPEGASDALVGDRRARAEAALARVRGGEAFETVAREVSEDSNRAQGGVIGPRPADRLPDVFMDVVRPMKSGEVAAQLLRTGAGFHVLKLVEKREPDAFTIQQTRAQHILLRVSPQLSAEAASARLREFKRQIEAGSKAFEALARENSEDGSAAQGGDLGWASPGMFVPEFEETMNKLPIGGISDPVVSRFGVHLIRVRERREQTLEPRQQREQARNALREQKFDEAFGEWQRELRARAYVEMREAPQ
jgi:peptidyl-prolyl cis-trans isomerase SurA